MSAHETPLLSGTPPASPFLIVEDVAKSYGGAHALKGVSLSMMAGEVHSLGGC